MQANTKDWAEWLKLETFDDPELIAMVNSIARFGRAFKTGLPARWLSLLGVSGVGKSKSAKKLFSFMAARMDWKNCSYIHRSIYWPAFVGKLKSDQNFSELSDLAIWPVLLLDDIGAERDTSGFSTEQLNMLLGQRVGKWTIITGNLTLAQLAKCDTRIADRIIREPGNELVEVNTKSYGLRINK